MKVAVILNENELQRYGHPNVIPFFERIFKNDLQKYNFISFTSINIDSLFSLGKKGLFLYDSIYISTNACNDEDILSTLVNNANLIEEFINSGRGIFVGYQKKISVSDNKKLSFLPEIYTFDVVRKEFEYESWLIEQGITSNVIPKEEKSSSTGFVRANYENREDVVLNYPRQIHAYDIESRCKDEKNGFRAHVYRAIIRPKYVGAYEVLLHDDSYDNARPLLCKCVTGNNERIIVTSMALDWEQQEDILYNVIKYITEGVPYIALVTNDYETDGNFRYLMSTMSLNKITHCVLLPDWIEKSMQGEETYLEKLIKIYAFSSSISRHLVDEFWNKKKNTKQMKVYYFEKNQEDDDQVLLEYSNTSSIDSLVNNVLLWVNSQYSGGMFKGSFWTTYDTLNLYQKLGVQYSSFIFQVFKDIFENHYFKENDGSYDGLIGCTVGLLEQMIEFKDDIKLYFSEINEYIEKTKSWILEKLFDISRYEQISVINCFCRLQQEELLMYRYGTNYDDLLISISNEISADSSSLSKDLARYIEFFINHNKDYKKFLGILLQQQDEYGAWNGIVRTANIIIFLVEHFERLCLNLDSSSIDELTNCIELGVIYLSSEYDEKNFCWANDFLSTIKAALAIGLYNKHFQFTTKDFSETIQTQTKELIYSELTSNAISIISSQRKEIYDINAANEKKIADLTNQNITIKEALDEQNRIFNVQNEELELVNSRIKLHGKIIISLAVACIILLGLIIYKYEAYIDIFIRLMSYIDIKDIATNTVSSIVIFIFTGAGALLLFLFVGNRKRKKMEEYKNDR